MLELVGEVIIIVCCLRYIKIKPKLFMKEQDIVKVGYTKNKKNKKRV